MFTVPNLGSFSPEIHLSLADIGIYSCDAPTCFRVSLKASKTEFFRKGCLIHFGKGNPPLYAIRLLMVYLRIKGNGAGPIFLFQDGKTFVPLLAYRLTMQDSEGGCCPRIFIKRQLLTSWAREVDQLEVQICVGGLKLLDLLLFQIASPPARTFCVRFKKSWSSLFLGGLFFVVGNLR